MPAATRNLLGTSNAQFAIGADDPLVFDTSNLAAPMPAGAVLTRSASGVMQVLDPVSTQTLDWILIDDGDIVLHEDS